LPDFFYTFLLPLPSVSSRFPGSAQAEKSDKK